VAARSAGGRGATRSLDDQDLDIVGVSHQGHGLADIFDAGVHRLGAVQRNPRYVAAPFVDDIVEIGCFFKLEHKIPPQVYYVFSSPLMGFVSKLFLCHPEPAKSGREGLIGLFLSFNQLLSRRDSHVASLLRMTFDTKPP